MTDFHDWNKEVIDESRANQGRVGGQFEGRLCCCITVAPRVEPNASNR